MLFFFLIILEFLMCFTVRRLYATFARSTKVLNFENTKGDYPITFDITLQNNHENKSN